MTPPIAILGAGPSGLLLGRLLEVADIDFVIFERDISRECTGGSGGTLDIHSDSGQLALKEAGLFEKFQKLARFDGSNRIANFQGKVLADLGADSDQNDRPEIDRRDLRSMLLDSISSGKVKWGKRVQEVVKGAGGSMDVQFEDGSVEKGFKLVVGADGTWSRVRSLITSATPEYSGYYLITSHIRPGNPHFPSAESLAGKGNYMAFGNCQQLSVMLLGDGSYHTGLGFRAAENWNKLHPLSTRRAMIQEYCKGWPETERNVIVNSDDEFRAWPLYAMPTTSLCWESVPGVVLIGDAAHVSTPFEGEGVNCALYDSLQLAQKIRQHGMASIDQVVKEYEHEMFPRAIDLISRSEKQGELLYAVDAPKRFLQEMGIEC